ncbi:Crp/Fnr family transcriptional regulator [Telluribacter sp. SYSU D00476]|uniref:Crp/Fnr family transcriptional regulator n=1 Tax=Telluribacter sp. SYSU D00476 TaxID=2811430 RepID=UPI001FF1F20B|nr:Crp/Fnr family transcriptional regulator [Telluribacter sp. SYSU D00476]
MTQGTEHVSPVTSAIARLSPLSAIEVEALEKIIHRKQLPRNTDLLKVGQVSYHMYFVNIGLVRVYYHRDDLDVTDYFAIDQQFIGGVESLFTRQPSRKAIQLIEDSDLYYFSATDFEACCLKYHGIETAARKLATFAFLEGQQRIESIRFYSAKERYDELERKYPGISNRCPLKYIASYLNITQVSLSRIRAGTQ